MKAREDGVESTRLQTSDFAQVVAVTPGTTVPHQSLQNGNGLLRYAHSRYATYVDLACQARTAQNNGAVEDGLLGSHPPKTKYGLRAASVDNCCYQSVTLKTPVAGSMSAMGMFQQ